MPAVGLEIERSSYLHGPVQGISTMCHRTMQERRSPIIAARRDRVALISRGAGTKLMSAPSQQR